MLDTSVKLFRSTDSGAPTLSGTAGALVTLLDACLISGYGSVTLDSMVVSGNVVTCTKAAGHGFTMIETTGPVIRIEGATPTGLNGDWRITVSSSTVFTFVVTGISNQTATGTITAKRAPAGWVKAFSGTNKAAYARTALSATAMLLRVDDSPAQYPTLIMYEAMTGIDTGTGLAPTSSSYFTAKSATANATARPWRLYVDGAAMYLFINANTAWESGFFFGDINSYKSGDAYRCVLVAHATAAVNYFNLYRLADSTAALLSRSYAQTGAAILSARYSHGISSQLGNGGSPYKNPVDDSFHAWPVEAWEGTTQARGLMPGLWNPIHISNSIADGTVITDIPQLAGRTVLVQGVGSTAQRCAVDITGPWR